MSPYQEWQALLQAREEDPTNWMLADKEHRAFMRYKSPELGVASYVMPIGYYAAKKFFQQSPYHEALGSGRLGRLGGLLDEPIIDPGRTSPATLNQMWQGILGAYEGRNR